MGWLTREAALLSASPKQSISTSTIPRPLPCETRPIWSQTRKTATGKWSSELQGVEGPQRAAPRTQCYKNGLVFGGLQANGLDEDPVMKGLVEIPAGWLSGLCPSLADPWSPKEEPFCC